MNAMSILRGLEQRALAEPTPIFDRLMLDVGSLLAENPWRPEFVAFEPWAAHLPADYEVPSQPLRVALDRLKRMISSRFATQQMEVIVRDAAVEPAGDDL